MLFDHVETKAYFKHYRHKMIANVFFYFIYIFMIFTLYFPILSFLFKLDVKDEEIDTYIYYAIYEI